ncbi:MAG TPA: sugar ABC transporter permease [Candidatus Limnocylindria bacterium]|nr:sugar ABC transporter permease [Candidatus Limnocylindria bacterium]
MRAGVLARPVVGVSRRRRVLQENVLAYVFVLPAIVVILIFQFLPGFAAVYMSLFRWDIVQGTFRGLDNYATVLAGSRAEEFWQSLSVTFTYTLITVPVEIVVSLVLAYLLFQKMRGRGIYRTLYYLPYITSAIAASVIFNWLMNPNYGLFNTVLGLVGIGPQTWLDEPRGIFELIATRFGIALPDWSPFAAGSQFHQSILAGPSLALVGVSIYTIWHFIGFQVVIFLAGLGNISNEYYEAARLDGASERQLFTKITLPLLSPTTFFVATIATIGSLKAFNQIYAMTNGGPLETTKTLGYEIFHVFFQQGRIDLGAAMAVLLTVIILLFTAFQFRVAERRVHYG